MQQRDQQLHNEHLKPENTALYASPTARPRTLPFSFLPSRFKLHPTPYTPPIFFEHNVLCVTNFEPDLHLLFGDFLRLHSGILRTQKLKTHLLRKQSSEIFSLKPGVDQYIAMHATPTARNFFLANLYFLVNSPSFLPKSLPRFSCVSCG